jgi:hypothetical protein
MEKIEPTRNSRPLRLPLTTRVHGLAPHFAMATKYHRAQVVRNARAWLVQIDIIPRSVEVVQVPGKLVISNVDQGVVSACQWFRHVCDRLPDVNDHLLGKCVLEVVINLTPPATGQRACTHAQTTLMVCRSRHLLHGPVALGNGETRNLLDKEGVAVVGAHFPIAEPLGYGRRRAPASRVHLVSTCDEGPLI